MTRKLLAGDIVEVFDLDEIHASVADDQYFREWPVTPEMHAFTGQTIRLSRRPDESCDRVYKTRGLRLAHCIRRGDLRCDDKEHDGGNISCLVCWKETELKRVGTGCATPPLQGNLPRDAPRCSMPTRARQIEIGPFVGVRCVHDLVQKPMAATGIGCMHILAGE